MKPLIIEKNAEFEIYACNDAVKSTIIAFYDGAVQCGFKSPAEDYVHEQIDVRDILIDNPEASFVIKVTGVSMIDDGISPGDYLLVDRSKQYKPDGIALCYLNNEFTVKRVNVETATLTPANKDIKPVVLSEGDELQVWGMVNWILKKAYGK